MQQGGNVADDFESDESRQHENEKRVDQVIVHVHTPVFCHLSVEGVSPSEMSTKSNDPYPFSLESQKAFSSNRARNGRTPRNLANTRKIAGILRLRSGSQSIMMSDHQDDNPLSNTRQGRHLEKVPDAGTHYFATVGDHGLANNFILQVQLQLTFLHHVEQERGDVAGIHLAGVVRNAGGQVDGADDGDSVA